VDSDKGFQVKRLVVNPGAKLSLQKHARRAEHWVVVRGTARVTRDREVYDLQANQSTYIPLGAVHRLENPGSEFLSPAQSGDYAARDQSGVWRKIKGGSKRSALGRGSPSSATLGLSPTLKRWRQAALVNCRRSP
jgi:mannose-1-phosphate guanylyltransferase/mannose-6-phosphate isomerase